MGKNEKGEKINSFSIEKGSDGGSNMHIYIDEYNQRNNDFEKEFVNFL